VTPPGWSASAGIEQLTAEIDRLLAVADAELESGYPGDHSGRQPVHTAYIPAHRFEAGACAAWGEQALFALAEHAPDDATFAAATGLHPGLAGRVRPLVLDKLAAEPVEDVRIDFEDGYGVRGDETEDAHARAAARALAEALRADGAPPFCGLRCKSLERQARRRALRTLDVFLATLLDGGRRPLPPGFVITLPKVTSAAQVGAMALICARLEAAHGLAWPSRLMFEIQVETPQLIVGADGAATIARCVHAGAGRLIGLHYGTYDYSAALGIPAARQSLDHPAADYAKSVLQVAAAGTGVRLCDGSTNVLPVGTHDEITAAWRLHARLVRRSLDRGFYQGWDLHPAQLVTRYAATYAFYREQLPAAATRLSDHAARTTRGTEEPATIKALAAFVLRALTCGATTETELTALTGLSRAQLSIATRSGRLLAESSS